MTFLTETQWCLQIHVLCSLPKQWQFFMRAAAGLSLRSSSKLVEPPQAEGDLCHSTNIVLIHFHELWLLAVVSWTCAVGRICYDVALSCSRQLTDYDAPPNHRVKVRQFLRASLRSILKILSIIPFSGACDFPARLVLNRKRTANDR